MLSRQSFGGDVGEWEEGLGEGVERWRGGVGEGVEQRIAAALPVVGWSHSVVVRRREEMTERRRREGVD